jgi:outer membrane protein assembly factor BamB
MARTSAMLAACLLALGAASAGAQTWEYKSYKKSGAGGTYDKDRFVTGTIAVEEKDGKHFFRMNAGALDACYRGEVPVTLAKTDATTTIESQMTMAGCDDFRYVIRNDGSGGTKYNKRGDRWAKSPMDHGLTPAKP